MSSLFLQGPPLNVDLPYVDGYWTPQSLSAPLAWYSTYDSAALQQASGKATALLNLMRGNVNNLSQTTGADQLAVVANAIDSTQPGLQLTITGGQCLIAPSAAPFNFNGANTPFSATICFQHSTAVGGQADQDYICCTGYIQESGWRLGVSQYPGESGYSPYFEIGSNLYVGPKVQVNGSTQLVVGQNYILHMTYSGSGTAAGVQLYLEAAGVAVAETKRVGTDNLSGTPTNTDASQRFAIGAPWANSNAAGGILFDAIVNSQVYTSGDLASLTSFLVTLHGMS